MRVECQPKLCTFARLSIIMDIFRAAICTPILVGIFCGIAHVYLYKKPYVIIPSEYNNVRVDYYRNREIMINCLLTGVLICCVDLLMGISLDNILKKRLRIAGVVWMFFALLGLFLRNGFHYYIWKHEEWLGLHRLGKDMTPTVQWLMRLLFTSGVYYEVVKGLQFLLAICAQWEVKRPMSKIYAHTNFPRY